MIIKWFKACLCGNRYFVKAKWINALRQNIHVFICVNCKRACVKSPWEERWHGPLDKDGIVIDEIVKPL